MTDNTCLNCQHAIWKRTKAGALHPDKSGRCGWAVKVTVPNNFMIPRSSIWRGRDDGPFITIQGGFIDRRSPETNCATHKPIGEASD